MKKIHFIFLLLLASCTAKLPQQYVTKTLPDSLLPARRHVAFENEVNFRDLGGFKTTEGRTLKWGKIYRSDNLSELKTSEFPKFEDLHIKTVFDLRTNQEIEGKEDHLPAGVTHLHTPTVADEAGQIAGLKKRVIDGGLDEAEARKITTDFYKDAVSVNVDSLRGIIHRILDQNEPVLYHCSAGKDRTGIVSALILSILHVDRETIMKEYLMSNYYRAEKNSRTLGKAKAGKIIKRKMDLDAITVLITVDESFMQAVFDTIDQRYGGMDNFIKNQLGYDATARSELVLKYTD
ncbi:tyrosine-protein phosphatase [Dyadobacter luticola]|uniref:Tyrosine-protein phosphatase n=1 Tax=Dyadobacter luticola TaxID=1979387 RepID=A0A5R9L6D5_9BACT|nr:tyrosine-protein phosphatase [Dyadobacter luticola]TLV04123.1 tyrosine-protein phosphatase [Dyadobacter luticola]